MPGVVEDYSKQREYQDGYDHRVHELWVDYEHKLNLNPEFVDRKSPYVQRYLAHSTAIKASQQIAENAGQSISREFDTGQRNAIRDWSHARNHELLGLISEEMKQHIEPRKLTTTSTQQALTACYGGGSARGR